MSYYFEPHKKGDVPADLDCMICGSFALHRYMLSKGMKPTWEPTDIDILDRWEKGRKKYETTVHSVDVIGANPIKLLRKSYSSVTNVCVNRSGYYFMNDQVPEDIKSMRMHVHPIFVYFPGLGNMFWERLSTLIQKYTDRGFVPRATIFNIFSLRMLSEFSIYGEQTVCKPLKSKIKEYEKLIADIESLYKE